MRRRNPFLALAATLIILASCQKEKSVDTLGSNGSSNGGSTGGNTEAGTWKFISTHITGTQTAELNDGFDNLKDVTLSDYITENNAGTLKFDGSKLTTTNITYSVNTISKVYMYTNGVLDDSMDFPWTFTLPSYSSSGTYKKIGSDSLYIEGGMAGTGSTSGTIQPTSSGVKLKFDGDKMTMSQTIDDVNYQFVQGVQAKVTTHATSVITLQKQ